MLPARWFSPMLVKGLAVLLAVFLGSGAARAQVASGNTYTISGVDVDINASDPLRARDEGMRAGERQAVKLLVERMVAPEDRAKVPPVDDARLQGMVRGVEFAKERSAGTRYQATLNVVFSAEPVKSWLGEAGIGIVETVQRAALVVPLLKDKNGVEPMDDRNPWRDAWQALDTSGSAVPVTVVRADQLDQNALSVEEAYVGDVTALTRLNNRYRAPTIIVAIAEGSGTSFSLGGLRYDTQTGARSDLPRLTVDDPKQLPDAVKKMYGQIEQAWRNVATVRRDSPAALDAFVPINGLADWVQVRQRLGAIPAIKGVTVKTLESDRASIHVDYFGTPDQLQQTLSQAGLQLTKDGDEWRLQPR